MPRIISSFLLLFLAILSLPAHAQSVPVNLFPKFTNYVVDAGNIMEENQEKQLIAKLNTLQKQTGRQVIVATVPSLGGYEPAEFGYQLGRYWGIGDKEKNDGILMLIAPKERKMRIEVGYGLEGIVTDAISSQIIRNDITPRFKDGDYFGGISAGVDELSMLLTLPEDEARAYSREVEKNANEKSKGSAGMFFVWFLIFIFVVLPFIRSAHKRGKRYSSGGSTGPIIIWGNDDDWGGGGGSGWGGGGSGWGGGGFGGGGFGGGGGGSFGGGGAGGGW